MTRRTSYGADGEPLTGAKHGAPNGHAPGGGAAACEWQRKAAEMRASFSPDDGEPLMPS